MLLDYYDVVNWAEFWGIDIFDPKFQPQMSNSSIVDISSLKRFTLVTTGTVTICHLGVTTEVGRFASRLLSLSS